ncbi:hypothetical protein D0T25_18450 [Duganella sp. BJB488]|uniref:hypothetical protein n=1 Tax=unclassified Duganella TaxID=2636909 RepID=UPI000E3474D9|nr:MULTISPECIES: hypothetical protein [unclassified Duganella]RFP15121.1 hypothetical protein D0T26_19250 [Duganella sp. BJB489]RFP19675.1 hypothetical protein D0T25_18450 [Duganella sp. BJB488]RFP38065.1 hypothetical protein D0T24_00200 [Duganella sp. BJB480]
MADQHDIEALADSLSASADALHAHLMRALRKPAPGGGAPAMSQGTAQVLFENEVLLRQRANSLYLDSARLAAAGLGGAQQQLLDLARRAEDAIARIDRVKDMIDLTAELLSLGAAVATGKPDHLAAPLEKLKHHLDALPAPG